MSETELATLAERGLAEQRAGRHPEAIATLREVIGRGGGDAALLCRLGQSYEAVRDYVQADASYVAAIERDPDHLEACRRAAAMALRASALASRVGQSQPAQQLRAGAFRFSYILGTRLVARQAWAEAEAVFRKALALNAEDWAAHIDLGRCLYEQGRHEQAEAAIRAGIRLGPDQPLAHFFLGQAMLRAARTDEAEAALRRALALDPKLALAQTELAAVIAKRERPA